MNKESCIGCYMLNNENNALAKENARLREALKQIAEGQLAPTSFGGYVDEAYQQIARAALEGQRNV